MTRAEFKNAFLLEYDRHASLSAPGFNDYGISYWLTRAQEDLVKDYMDPNFNPPKQGFEETEKRRRKLAKFMVPLSLDPAADALAYDPDVNIHPNSLIYRLEDGSGNRYRILEIKMEYLRLTDPLACKLYGDQLQIVPVTHDQYNQAIQNPFRTPSKYYAWRIDMHAGLPNENGTIEIISSISYDAYILRYVRRPLPIIVEDISSLGLTIDGLDTPSEAESDPIVHLEIVSRAVTLALENIVEPRFQTHMLVERQQVK